LQPISTGATQSYSLFAGRKLSKLYQKAVVSALNYEPYSGRMAGKRIGPNGKTVQWLPIHRPTVFQNKRAITPTIL